MLEKVNKSMELCQPVSGLFTSKCVSMINVNTEKVQMFTYEELGFDIMSSICDNSGGYYKDINKIN